MKYTLLAAAFVGASMAQGISSLPACGVSHEPLHHSIAKCADHNLQQTCINNMLAQANSLGCPNLPNNTPNGTCLCQNADFGYGIHDCVAESCPTSDQTTVIDYGVNYCKSGRPA